MYEPIQVVQEQLGRPRDRLAVALGNASFLGVGYLMLRRRGFAFLSWLITVVLLAMLVSGYPTVAFEIVVVVWWAAMIAHGWWLAGRPAPAGRAGRPRLTSVRAQRVLAACITVPVLVALGLLRFDAARIDNAVTQAREHGSCAQAVKAIDGIWLGDRLADAPLTTHDDQTSQVCGRLHAARGTLSTGVDSGDTTALKTGFADLGWVLANRPGHEKMVDSVLTWFLHTVPSAKPCDIASVTDWLRARKPTHNALDRAADIVPRTAPAALVGCGDDLMTSTKWTRAKARYQQLLDQYPHDSHADAARKGVRRATLAIELDNVRDLLDTPTSAQPTYCSSPARYEAAPAYRHHGTNKTLFYGNDTYSDKLPSSWDATDASDAVLVACLGAKEQGTAVQTCPYQYLGATRDVTFHKIAIPVKVYELRTGKLIIKRTIQISGSSCPETLSYTTYYYDSGPPSDVYVTASKSDVRSAFDPLIAP